jgi:hypothetical protein
MPLKLKSALVFATVMTVICSLMVSPMVVSAASGLAIRWYSEFNGAPVSAGWGVTASNDRIYASGTAFDGAAVKPIVVVYGTDGSMLWSRSLEGLDGLTAYCTTSREGSIYVGGGAGVGEYGQAFIAELNPDGRVRWQCALGAFSDAVMSIAVGKNAVYAVGTSLNLETGSYDVMVWKLTLKGTPVWTASWGGGFNGMASSVALIGDEIVVGGAMMMPAGNYNAFLLKYDPDGNLVGQNVWGGIYDAVSGVAVCSGRIYVTGITMASYEGITAQEVFLATFDPSLQRQSYVTWGGAGNDGSTSIATDGRAVYVSGATQPAGAGRWEAFVLKFDESGSVLGSAKWGGDGDGIGNAIAVKNGRVYSVGTVQSDAGARLMVAGFA